MLDIHILPASGEILHKSCLSHIISPELEFAICVQAEFKHIYTYIYNTHKLYRNCMYILICLINKDNYINLL